MKIYEVEVNGQVYQVKLKEVAQGEGVASTPTIATPTNNSVETAGQKVNAPMAGTILAVKVSLGQTVKKGDTLVILEAMKMENEVVAPADGVVQQIVVVANQGVESNELLVVI
ncbi:biotin carboxyl carrier protein [Enterococcus sp. PF1-24]|uniref:biotin/lipoyl-containing protein n=1 Tax=unclassified Enterococcus TaxID=2608891 RepID=UPI002472F0C6|nr:MULTISPECIES: biotin/lipoyl-containing protein [unclassified Enterococcus]MDH6364602.1 biotin carboxyl carrier protein [Enterococcus sp. PFB1-1]MDH6401703.1 biotin carboxyl carrier protein [Enterococcus sp. PF1-24]